VLTIEDTRELVVPQRNHVHMMYSKDGTGLQKAGAKELLESALRMRPDRILLQELRDGTAFSTCATSTAAIRARSPRSTRTRPRARSNSSPSSSRNPRAATISTAMTFAPCCARWSILWCNAPSSARRRAPARYRMTEVWFDPESKPQD
jgi:type IV secretion system protein VirB11